MRFLYVFCFFIKITSPGKSCDTMSLNFETFVITLSSTVNFIYPSYFYFFRNNKYNILDCSPGLLGQFFNLVSSHTKIKNLYPIPFYNIFFFFF